MVTYKLFKEMDESITKDLIEGQRIEMSNIVEYDDLDMFEDDMYYVFVDYGMGRISTKQMEFEDPFKAINTFISFMTAYKLEKNKKCLYGLRLMDGKEVKNMAKCSY